MIAMHGIELIPVASILEKLQYPSRMLSTCALSSILYGITPPLLVQMKFAVRYVYLIATFATKSFTFYLSILAHDTLQSCPRYSLCVVGGAY
jgi:phosphotransferase system  glucose/maltose/N-acetylglucosamine-specific IIC component